MIYSQVFVKRKAMKKTADKKRLVLVGGGFAGSNFVRKLFNNRHFDVTLVDKNNYNYFTPLLYQVATSFLEPAAISYPFRKLLKKRNVAFRMATVSKIDSDSNRISMTDGTELDYDVLVLAAGSTTNYFGNKSLIKGSFPIKDVADALYLRNEIIKTLEKASIEKNPKEKQKLLTIVIAGGGPTGVELAGMMAEFKNGILAVDYPELINDAMTIYLVEGAPYLLPPMSEKTHKEALNVLARSGVVVKLNTRVNAYADDLVLLSDNTVIKAKTLIWAAGVTVQPFEGIAADSIGKGNRIITDCVSRVKGYDNIYAIGDISVQYTDKAYPTGHPQLAQPAIQQGKTLAKNLLRMAEGKSMKPFKFFDRGDMAIIGRKWAMADLFKHRLHVGGLPGLLAWLFIHLVSLVNYNNKIRTLYSWLVAYLTHDQVLRMIFLSEKHVIDEPVGKQKLVKDTSLLKDSYSKQAAN